MLIRIREDPDSHSSIVIGIANKILALMSFGFTPA